MELAESPEQAILEILEKPKERVVGGALPSSLPDILRGVLLRRVFGKEVDFDEVLDFRQLTTVR